jgi:hypothetical protein
MSTFITSAQLFNTASFNVGTTAVCTHLVSGTACVFARFLAGCQSNDFKTPSNLEFFCGEMNRHLYEIRLKNRGNLFRGTMLLW